jgi:arginine decarboxylase
LSSFIPKRVFLTNGGGRHKEKLNSFELALRDAGIAHCNLVPVSSIFPPSAQVIGKKEGLKLISPGQVVFVVLSRNETNEPNRLISAAVGLTLPRDKNMYGYLSEVHAFGMTESKAADYSEDLAVYMLASTMGLAFDPDKSWDELKQEWKISGKIFRTTHVVQSAEGDKNGLWTSVLAACVLLP